MNICLSCSPDVFDLLHPLVWKYRFIVAASIFNKLESLNVSVLCQTWSSETIERLGHEYPSHSDAISRCALSCIFTLSSNFDRSRYMTYRNLITRLLNLYVLETHKFWGSDRHHKRTFNLVDFALISWALHQWIELPLPNHLVNFKSTHVAHIYCYLHLRLDITRSHNDAPNRDKVSNLLSSDFSHFGDVFFAELSMDNEHLIAAFELLWNHSFAGWVNLLLY